MDENLVMETDGVLAFVDFPKFFVCIGGNIEDIIAQNEFSHEVCSFINLDSESMSLENHVQRKRKGEFFRHSIE